MELSEWLKEHAWKTVRWNNVETCKVKVADGAAAWTHKTEGEIKSSPVPLGDSPADAYSSAPTTAASMGSISPLARKSGNTKSASPVTSSPAVAKGKVVVATRNSCQRK